MKTEVRIGTEGEAVPMLHITAESMLEQDALGRLCGACEDGKKLRIVFTSPAPSRDEGTKIVCITAMPPVDWATIRKHPETRIAKALDVFNAPLSGTAMWEALAEVCDAVAAHR